ncbi:MAG: flagellar basal body rod protein FlgC, partial [Blastomonas fulva]|uniref:flagellar basal body rod protein FlgC n=1 Tax=Blastomonas fulva TaxID=1550728 RepID=UPI004034B545
MPGPMNIFDISGRAMSAQLSRLNTTASNLANARTTYSSEAEAYRAIKPVFKTIEESPGVATVQVDKVIQSDIKPVKRHDPTNPLADEEGYVWDVGVDET